MSNTLKLPTLGYLARKTAKRLFINTNFKYNPKNNQGRQRGGSLRKKKFCDFKINHLVIGKQSNTCMF